MGKSKALVERPILSENCIICHTIFIKKHPKDNRCICEKCADKIAELIGVKE